MKENGTKLKLWMEGNEVNRERIIL
jgi:hypothetical protein